MLPHGLPLHFQELVVVEEMILEEMGLDRRRKLVLTVLIPTISNRFGSTASLPSLCLPPIRRVGVWTRNRLRHLFVGSKVDLMLLEGRMQALSAVASLVQELRIGPELVL